MSDALRFWVYLTALSWTALVVTIAVFIVETGGLTLTSTVGLAAIVLVFAASIYPFITGTGTSAGDGDA